MFNNMPLTLKVEQSLKGKVGCYAICKQLEACYEATREQHVTST